MTQIAVMPDQVEGLTPVEYARDRGITLGAVYAKLWAGRLPARKLLGRWIILTEPNKNKAGKQ
jgi:hypothetical protein